MPLTSVVVVDNAHHPSVSVGAVHTDALINSTVANTFYEWSMCCAQATCDLITLDSRLHESYVKRLEEEKKLKTNYNTFSKSKNCSAG